jgi:hypothetical protein
VKYNVNIGSNNADGSSNMNFGFAIEAPNMIEAAKAFVGMVENALASTGLGVLPNALPAVLSPAQHAPLAVVPPA